MEHSPAADRIASYTRRCRHAAWMRNMLVSACLSVALGGMVRATDIIVTIDRLSSTKGTMLLELDSEASWQNKVPPVATAKATPTGQSLTIIFRDVKPATYAVSIFQDENNNGQFDTNFLGIPKEGWGFSNNPRAMRKATFDEAKFSVEQTDVALTIHLMHFF